MAEIRVTEKRPSHRWAWLIALLILGALIWFLLQAFSNDRTATAVPESRTGSAPVEMATPQTAPPAGDVAATMAAAGDPAAPATAAGTPITDTGAYGASGDKLALAGRRAEFSDARVTRIVGPKTFTIASGGEELYVMLADDLDKGVGSQGAIDMGSVLNVTGSFRRLTPEEIGDISDNRFRDLTEAERGFLRNLQVYLNATSVRKVG